MPSNNKAFLVAMHKERLEHCCIREERPEHEFSFPPGSIEWVYH